MMIKRIKVIFIKDIYLPRFSMKIGETWTVRVDRFEEKGFQLGSGFVYNEDFAVKEVI